MSAESLQMRWLPTRADWNERLSAVGKDADLQVWADLVSLANSQFDFTQMVRLDRALRRRFESAPPAGLGTRPIRLAVLGASTVEYLLPGIRVGALRHGLWVEVQTVDYGQYLPAILDPASTLHGFKPDVVLFAFDALHFLGDEIPPDDDGAAAVAGTMDRLRDLWRKTRDAFGCEILMQTFLPVALPLMGNNEHRLPHSRARLIRLLNEELRVASAEAGVDLLAIDDLVSAHGLSAWHDPLLWHRAKQAICPLASPLYGEHVARILAARQGRSAKCLVLDLDNTLWGGVIGDDGLDGIVLGQGSSLGEAYLAIQRHARDLSRRGVILAVCSKNDESNALAPFEKHPEMLLRRSDIACFVANWEDKAENIRQIARTLNIGLDAMVFLDDNPFERNLVRAELPMVRVPELPDEPALYPHRLAEAGCFEALWITSDDMQRARQYQANVARESLRTSATDIDSYLRSLDMQLHWGPFDRVGLKRITQLINKTNQFNLTTRRYTEAEVAAMIDTPTTLTLQMRLADKYGDNGIIGVVIAHKNDDDEIYLDTWLMSCRVLGRGVEKATLNLVAELARQAGAKQLRGVYRPSAKNAMVKTLYADLGFQPSASHEPDALHWTLHLDAHEPKAVPISIKPSQT